MATPGNNSNLGKKDRREAAREKARQDREAERKRTRRNKLFLQGGVGLAVIAIAAVVMLVVVNQPKPVELSSNTAGPANMISDGILLAGNTTKAVETPGIKKGADPVPTDLSKHSDTVNIVTYIDFQCPVCQAFEATNGQQIKSWVDSGLASVEIHPISILDNSSLGNKYSTRSANAAACVAQEQPQNFYAVMQALFEHQPAESTSGRTDAEILKVLKDAGASGDKITSCVKKQEFANWVTAASARVQTAPFPNTVKPTTLRGTPTVFVDGQQYSGGVDDAPAFKAFVEGIAKAK
ncbi:DsbA family protein [Parafrigoribacterium soli]|uniref:DsbA family protein n=1 Tax=Parafrigoribacterium soli TaxID=3144663 RepID=UPI0032F03470